MKAMTVVGGAIALIGMFQMPGASPVQIGLWESTSSMTMTIPGIKLPPRPPVVTRTRSCVTAATWAKAFANDGRAASCVRSHEMYAAGRLSFDLTCPNQDGKGHVEMRFDGDTGHGTVHLQMNAQGHAVISQTAIASRFVGASCGAVVPGTPKLVP